MRSSFGLPGTSSVTFPLYIVEQVVIDEHGMNKADKNGKQSKSENPDYQIKYIDNDVISHKLYRTQRKENPLLGCGRILFRIK